jgi:hypothetical protein
LLAIIAAFKGNQGDLDGATVLYHQAADIRRQTDTLDTGRPSAKRQRG